MGYQVRLATPSDAAEILELFPRLAAFDLPVDRVPEHLWRGDAKLLRAWAAGVAPQCVVHIAIDSAQSILGVAMAQLRDELLSHEPSAHLEVLVVRAGAERQGIGQALVESIETAVRERGAHSLTLHVFESNARARALYDRLGYNGELIRYIKRLG